MNFPYHTESVSQLIRGKFHENNYTFFNPSLTWLPKSSIPAGWRGHLEESTKSSVDWSTVVGFLYTQ